MGDNDFLGRGAVLGGVGHGDDSELGLLWPDEPIWRGSVFLADGHTASNAPDLFRPPKLSNAGPG